MSNMITVFLLHMLVFVSVRDAFQPCKITSKYLSWYVIIIVSSFTASPQSINTLRMLFFFIDKPEHAK